MNDPDAILEAVSLWRDRDFLKLWGGQIVSEIGSRITRDGMPLAAVLLLHAGPGAMGIMMAANGAGALLGGPLAGFLVDRLPKRPLLIAVDLARAALLVTIPLAAMTGSLSMLHLYAVSLLAGLLTLFFDVAYQCYLPALVERDQLLEGNSKLALSNASAEIVGPPLAGALVQWLTAPKAILIDAASFVVSALSILAIRRPERQVAVEAEQGLRQLGAGARFIIRHPLLRPLMLRTVTGAVSFGFFSSLYVYFAISVLRLTPALLGLVIGLGGVGNFIAASAAEHLPARIGLGRLLILSSLLAGIATFLIPLAHGTPFESACWLGAAQLFGDVLHVLYNINELTLRQSITPPALLGRVNAFMQVTWKAGWPLGALLGGALAVHAGARAAMVVSAAGVTLSTLWLIFSPLRSLAAIPQTEDAALRH